ncbi:hypothetical protein [Massilia sp. H6]|uniref:hypothetical protein n=1 Tax=Massilia sp. H6 TaxID=2970464 RepID=UPI00216A454F|nr:hypothetical protein [Massilia sp. H6]UVW30247.1 hypothetical protein NRS07_09045 [Massilia sp. H6]
MPRKSVAVTVAPKRSARKKAEPEKPAKAAQAPARPAKAATRARPAAKASARSGVKNAVKAAAKSLSTMAPRQRARKAPAPAVPVAAARPVLVRDSFTMPEGEYAVLAEVKSACLRAGIEVKKSELLRVGVALLGQVDIATLKAVLAALPQLKTGRPPTQG